ncbi:MAG: DUF4412 domain-containing protein [Verrucomicrobiae bacterium]|nr:DUF4412 domain-containing protein [Verrucomicrobiae bacterium]
MKITLPIAICLLATTSARADITLEQDMLLNGVSSRTTMWIKGDKVRTDNGSTSSVIIDTSTGDMTTLMHEQKMAVKMNTKQLQALAAQAPGGNQTELPETKVTATGQKETIDGKECEIYLSENQGMVVKMWITKDYPGVEKLREQLKVMAKLAAPNAPKQPDVPGIALKTEFEQQGMKFTTKLISLTDGPVSEDKFVVPADYKAP